MLIATYIGRVDRVDDGVCYVTLRGHDGQKMYGTYPENEMLLNGVKEGGRFAVNVIKDNDSWQIAIEPMEERKITAEEWEEIDRKVAEVFKDYNCTDDDDY